MLPDDDNPDTADDEAPEVIEKSEKPAPKMAPPSERPADDTTETEEVEQPKKVDLRALKEERERRKELSARLDEERALRGRMEARYNEIVQRLQTPPTPTPPPPVPEPVFDQDPQGWMRYQIEELHKKVGSIGQTAEQQRRAEQQASGQSQIVKRYQASAAEFSKKQPDLMDAYKFLTASRLEELREGFGIVDPLQAQAIVEADEMNIAQRAFQSGQNPAERIYKLAVMRGYKPAMSGNGEGKLAQVQARQTATKTLSGTGGTEAPQKGTVQWLVSLEGAAFDQAFEKMKAEGKLG